MKKLLALLLALVLVVGVFAGCTKTETPVTPDKPSETDKPEDETPEPVTLKWVGAGWLANEKADTLISRYKEEAPNVTIEYNELSNLVDEQYLQMLDTMVAGGEQLDITYLGVTDLLVRAINGAALPLNDAIAANGDDFVKDYTALAANLLSVDGDIYAVPYANNTFKVFYNKTMTDAAGVTIPDQWSIDEFTAIAEKLNDPAKNVWGCVFPSTWSDLCYAPAEVAGWKMVTKDASGKVIVNFDDPIFRQCMQWVADLTLTKAVSPSYAIIKAESLNRRVALATGQTAMIVDGPYTLVYLQNYMYNDPGAGPLNFELGITEIPYINEDARDNASFLSLVGAFYCPKTATNVTESYKFARFICNGNFDKGTYMPAYTGADMDAATALLTNYTTTKGEKIENIYQKDLATKAVSVAHESYLSYYKHDPALFAKYVPSIYKLFTEQYTAYVTGQVTLDAFVETMQTLGATEIANVEAAQ